MGNAIPGLFSPPTRLPIADSRGHSINILLSCGCKPHCRFGLSVSWWQC